MSSIKLLLPTVPCQWNGEPEYAVLRCIQGHVMVIQAAYSQYKCPRCANPNFANTADADQFPCKHCNEFPQNHAVTEQLHTYHRQRRLCLFSPTQFEPMTQEELEAWVAL